MTPETFTYRPNADDERVAAIIAERHALVGDWRFVEIAVKSIAAGAYYEARFVRSLDEYVGPAFERGPLGTSVHDGELLRDEIICRGRLEVLASVLR